MTNNNQMVSDIREIAKIRGFSEDMAIVEIVTLFAPVYLKQLKSDLNEPKCTIKTD